MTYPAGNKAAQVLIFIMDSKKEMLNHMGAPMQDYLYNNASFDRKVLSLFLHRLVF